MITLSKKLRKTYAEPISNGWYVHRATNHFIWRHPSGGQVVTAQTPSDVRSIRNALAMFRRVDIDNNR